MKLLNSILFHLSILCCMGCYCEQSIAGPLEANSKTPLSGKQYKISHTTDARKLLLALKTNLLADVVLTPNLEIEVPVGERWSINMEYQYGWWLRKNNTFCWQIESGGIEGRYWFGDRQTLGVLNGWFTGFAVSGGMYDFQTHKSRGKQGEFFIPSITGGYSMKVAKNLNLEFSAGLGYLVSNYTKYNVIDNQLLKDGELVRRRSVFPAKAKVSLVWMIRKAKGGAR